MAKTTKLKQVIKSTQKTAVITQAMELVSASKLPHALSRLHHTRPYSEALAQMMSSYSQHSDLPYFKDLENDRHHVIIVLSTDRGLCGNLNLALFKEVLKKIKLLEGSKKQVSLAICGGKALKFFSDKVNILSHIDHLGDKPDVKDVMALMHPVISAFEHGDVDCIHIANNYFESTLSQQPQIEQVLPRSVEKTENCDHFLHEPNRKEVVRTLFRYYIESVIYQAVIESIACEHAARMIAMKNATDNANDIIRDLNLTYNKVRQALITQEIAEISAGALYADGDSL